MSFAPFAFKGKFFGIVQSVNSETKEATLTGKTSDITLPDLPAVEVGETIYLEPVEGTWSVIKVEEKVKKSAKGNPDFTAAELRAFKQMNG